MTEHGLRAAHRDEVTFIQAATGAPVIVIDYRGKCGILSVVDEVCIRKEQMN